MENEQKDNVGFVPPDKQMDKPRCRICSCDGWMVDPTDPSVCIAFSRPLNARCGHPLINH